MTRVALIVAVARNGIIGEAGALPWKIPSDLKRFKEITLGKPVIMGRKTWESLPKRPLSGRTNIVLTRQPAFSAAGACIAASRAEALAIAEGEAPQEIAVIGGGEIYRMFLPIADRIYLTEVDVATAGDTSFPAIDPGEWEEKSREVHRAGPRDSAGFTFRVLDRIILR